MSLQSDPSDAARARELYKYYRPPSFTEAAISHQAPAPFSSAPAKDIGSSREVHVRSSITSSKVSSPDTALTAFAQLVVWRTGAQRAMISLIDEDTQYFIAESTRSLDLVDGNRHDPNDGLWVGCSQVSKAGRLCERTLDLPLAPIGEYTAFIVPDLTKDERFNQLPFVTNPPYLKFYAGTPLITKRGIPIGSLFVVDDRFREGLSKDEIRFMGTVAGTIMRHMEMLREVEENRRGMKMSRGLASFMEGRSQLIEAEVGTESEEGSTIAGQFEVAGITPKSKNDSGQSSATGSRSESSSSIERKEREYSSAIMKVEETIMKSSSKGGTGIQIEQRHETVEVSSSSASDTSMKIPSSLIDVPSNKAQSPESPKESEALILKNLFSRAANLIREAFEVDGGSAFYDAQKGFGSAYSPGNSAESSIIAEDASSEDSRSNSDSMQTGPTDFTDRQRRTRVTSPSSSSRIFHRSSVNSDRTVEILGFSTSGASSIHGDEYPGAHSFVPLDEKSLHGFLKRYPRGELWTFDQEGCVSSSEEDSKVPLETQAATPEQTKRKQTRTAADATVLLKHFPGVRQVLFVPLWDGSRSRWLSCNFTWSTEPTRILSKQSELSFLITLGNSIMAEYSRLDTEIADQKKSDFIGSISHELRSPLHGILASAEFLGEEVSGAFAKGLVETIDSCGRTLLDTINHILDFSKINHLEKNWRRNRRAGLSVSRPGRGAYNSLPLSRSDLPMINLFADVDISILCEEVIEGVFAGHVFQNVTAPSFDMVPDSGGKMSDIRQYVSSSDTTDSEQPPVPHSVAVILDIDIENYHFTTQPGALRRVIMNLLGNALKYTSHGYVKIKLDTTDMEDLQPTGSTEPIPRGCITLTITDTGKGISSDFIRSKLFTPFAQENSLSSGTGLGLSIVRSIVALLEGEITIKSEVGRGTEVKVTLPLLREFPKGGDSSGSTPRSVSSIPKESEQVIDQLRARVAGKSVTLYGFSADVNDHLISQSNQFLKASIINFLTNWYGLRLVSNKQKADIVVANEPSDVDVANFARLRQRDKRGPAVLALCSQSARFERAYSSKEFNADIGFLAKPIGPLKLARAISQCLDGIPIIPTPSIERGPPLGGGIATGATDLTTFFEDLSLSPSGGEVLDNSRMTSDSENARKALESPTPTPSIEKHKEFPFPAAIERPQVPTTRSMPSDKESLIEVSSSSTTRTSAVLSKMEDRASILASSAAATAHPPATLPVPSLLLVDDNKINLRLLRTYMVRRNYSVVDEAENGLEAVNAFQSREDGYDIIFMDISMPVLDGFGATRQIRQIEQARKDKAAREGVPEPPSALVIAFTGLASSRDQSEAFVSGIDLFLTKPVAFKEVGKMLDNWEANQEREAASTLEGGKSADSSMSKNPEASLQSKLEKERNQGAAKPHLEKR